MSRTTPISHHRAAHSARIAIAAFGALAITACSAPAPEPTPSPPSQQSSAPTPVPAPSLPAPSYENWLDAPQTPGDWSYRIEQGETLALFGVSGSMTDFVIACRPANGQVALVRAGSASGPVPMRIRTETADRVVEAIPATTGPARLIMTFAANDPLLDAIAFSRGRFAVETAGMPALFIPAWPEITRVIEDCR